MESFESTSVFFQNQQKSLKFKTSEVIINAGDAFELPVLIHKPNTILQWVFHSQDYDIDFYITGKETPNQDEENENEEDDVPDLLEQKRYAATVPHQGQITIPEAGMYYIVWDNSYSWLREKHIVYSIELVFPEPTVGEARALAVSITTDLETKSEVLKTMIEEQKQTEQVLSTLESERNQKEIELKKLQDELDAINNNIHATNLQLEVIQTNKTDLKNTISSLYTMSPFFLNGVNMLSYMNGKDILQLASVNKYFNKALHQDFVWHHVFEKETEQNNAILLKNTWIQKKWELLRPDNPMPVFDPEAYKNEHATTTPISVHEIDADHAEEELEKPKEAEETKETITEEPPKETVSVSEPASEPVSEPATEPASEPATESTTETPQVVADPKNVSVSEPEDSLSIKTPEDAVAPNTEEKVVGEEKNDSPMAPSTEPAKEETEKTNSTEEQTATAPQLIPSVPPAQEKEAETETESSQTTQKSLSNLTELKLLHSITHNQGWYINGEDLCYYIYVVDEEQRFEVWTGPVSLSQLNQLYTKAKHSSVLIACPGTIQGESGYYIDRHRRVTQWTVSSQGWSEVLRN